MHISINQQNQRGIGMVEVLVALLLLAVGVLGFSALQSYAVYSTTESLNRTQALTIMRGLAERIRVNGTTSDILDSYEAAMGRGKPVEPTNLCMTTVCDATALAAADVYVARIAAWDSGIQLGMTNCPDTVGVGIRRCLLAAWDKTTPEMAASEDACMNEKGVYRREANCIVMEIY
ncbi:MAG: type IV pilus modification protein PilV [Moraxellaceae bacterium]